MHFNASEFTQRLRDTIRKRHITQRRLAELVGVSLRSVNQYCTEGCLPQSDILAKLAHHLEVSADFLLYGTTKSASAHEDIVYLAGLMANLGEEERATLENLCLTLARGTDDIRQLLSHFSHIAHELAIKHSALRDSNTVADTPPT